MKFLDYRLLIHRLLRDLHLWRLRFAPDLLLAALQFWAEFRKEQNLAEPAHLRNDMAFHFAHLLAHLDLAHVHHAHSLEHFLVLALVVFVTDVFFDILLDALLLFLLLDLAHGCTHLLALLDRTRLLEVDYLLFKAAFFELVAALGLDDVAQIVLLRSRCDGRHCEKCEKGEDEELHHDCDGCGCDRAALCWFWVEVPEFCQCARVKYIFEHQFCLASMCLQQSQFASEVSNSV